MGDICKQAWIVIVVVSHHFLFTQADWDLVVKNCKQVVNMLHNRSRIFSKESTALFESEEFTVNFIMAGQILQEFASITWMKRTWTAQEYILAVDVLFVGEDLRPFRLLSQDVENLCQLLQQNWASGEEDANDRFRALRSIYKSNEFRDLRRISLLRLGHIHPSKCMEVAHNRGAKFIQDEVYGLMGASNVRIAHLGYIEVEEIWERWWEQCIRDGHLLWAMLKLFNENDKHGCVMPPFQTRIASLRDSPIDWTEPLGHVVVQEGSIRFWGYIAGTCTISAFLCEVPIANEKGLSLYPDMVNLVKGDLSIARDLCAALTSGLHTAAESEREAQWLRSQYRGGVDVDHPTVICLAKWALFDLRFGARKNLVSMTVGAGKVYLARIENELKMTPILVYASTTIPQGRLIAVDIGTKAGPRDGPAETGHLMILSVPDGGARRDQALHRVGISGQLFIPRDRSLDRAKRFNGLVHKEQLQELYMGGKHCYFCSSNS
jgi:hypothetical protein